MKVIFPFAEHVPPLTRRKNYTPEPLLRCEAQPTLAHLIEPLCKLPVSEFIFIVDYQSDQIRSYMDANYSGIPASFVEQTENKGLGHTVSLASDYIPDEPILIVVGDAILDMDWTSFSQSEYSTIAVQRIIDEKPYGLVELHEGMVGCLIQKPRRTDLAIAGCYFIRESQLLFQCLHDLIRAGRRRNGEYQLTDALQQMIELGVEMQIQEVELANQEDTYQLKTCLTQTSNLQTARSHENVLAVDRCFCLWSTQRNQDRKRYRDASHNFMWGTRNAVGRYHQSRSQGSA